MKLRHIQIHSHRSIDRARLKEYYALIVQQLWQNKKNVYFYPRITCQDLEQNHNKLNIRKQYTVKRPAQHAAKVFSLILICVAAMCILACDTRTQREEHKVHRKATIHPPDYECLLADFMMRAAFRTHQFEVKTLRSLKPDVSEEEENEYGARFLEEISNSYEILNNDDLKTLERIMRTLLSARPADHKPLSYSIHLLNNPTVNAFTSGGHIFIFQGLLDHCSSVDELAFIIAHEIAHNELNHINLILKRIKLAGRYGEALYVVKQLLAASFNQFDELEADCYAIDLLMATSYDSRAGVKYWKRMAEEMDETPGKFESFFMTHPYDHQRYECSRKHLSQFYNKSL